MSATPSIKLKMDKKTSDSVFLLLFTILVLLCAGGIYLNAIDNKIELQNQRQTLILQGEMKILSRIDYLDSCLQSRKR